MKGIKDIIENEVKKKEVVILMKGKKGLKK